MTRDPKSGEEALVIGMVHGGIALAFANARADELPLTAELRPVHKGGTMQNAIELKLTNDKGKTFQYLITIEEIDA